MEKSLFHKNTPEDSAPTPHELIESEIRHLRKGSSVRHGDKARSTTAPWLVVLAFCGLAWLYLMDPIYHAWYKGEAIRVYLYLHNYGTETQAQALVATGILLPDEVMALNSRNGSYQGYFASPDAANRRAEAIIDYMTNLKLLHAGKYETLDPVGRMRYALFIHSGLVLPTQWTFLDPSVSD